jgi:hypothetical protein
MAIRHCFIPANAALSADRAIIYKAGAVVNAAQTVAAGGTITVRAGHAFTSGDKYLYALTRRNVKMSPVYTGATAATTTITCNVAITVPDAALLVPLGTDTVAARSDGSWPAPNYDGSAATIYKDPAGGSSYTNATVDVEPGGEVHFYYSDADGPLWAVLVDSLGRVVAVYEGVGDLSSTYVAGGGTSTDNAIVRFDGTSGVLIQGYTSGAPTVSDTGAITSYEHVTIQDTGAAGTTATVRVGTYPQIYYDAPNSGIGGLGAGLYIDSPGTTAAGSGAMYVARNGIINWILGEDYAGTPQLATNTEPSYFGLWSRYGYFKADDSRGSCDILAVCWAGAETEIDKGSHTYNRVPGQQGCDGPKWRWNSQFSPQDSEWTYSGTYQFEFYCPSKQTSGTGIWAALFDCAKDHAGAVIAIASGGVQTNVSGGRCGLNICQQNTDKRTAFIRAGNDATASFDFGVDLSAVDTQNFGIYDNTAGAYRLYIDPNGNVGLGLTSPTQELDVSKSQQDDTYIQVQNANAGTSARAGFVALAHGNRSLNMVICGDGYDGGTWANTANIWAGSGSKLYLGAGGSLQHYIDTTGTWVTPASATGAAGLNLPHGAAPTSPVNGDLWTTTAGLFVRINGATVGPLS